MQSLSSKSSESNRDNYNLLCFCEVSRHHDGAPKTEGRVMEDFQPRMSVFFFFFEYMKNDIMNNFERKKTEKGGENARTQARRYSTLDPTQNCEQFRVGL